MSRLKAVLSWVGIVVLGLAHGILEDLMFIKVLVEYLPPSWDLTGDLFFIFTVLAQLLTFAVTGSLAVSLGLSYLPKLITFWACWVVARTAFLVFALNPVGDVRVYLAWISLWCFLVGLVARSRRQPAGAND